MPTDILIPASPLPLAKRLAYAAPAFVIAVVGVPLFIYMPKFYSDVVGVDITTMGWILLVARLVDGVSDPFCGSLSDRTWTKFGRRRPYIAVGAILLAIFVWAAYVPPQLSPTASTWWFGFSLIGLSLVWTMVDVPWESLGPELTTNFHERTSLFALRDGLLLLGTMAAVASPALISWALNLDESPDAQRHRFWVFALVYVPLILVSCLWCVTALRESASKPQIISRPKPKWKTAFRNKPFLILLAAYSVGALGANLPATLVLFYVQYVLMAQGAEVYLLLYFVVGVAFLPIWTAISRRIGKKSAWLWSMAVNTFAFMGVFFLGPGDVAWYAGLVTVSGIGFGATVMLPSSMQADVIDYDELLSGSRREGLYIGIWSVVKKLTSALGIGLALPILGWAGYAPGDVQSEQVRLILRILYSLIPCLCTMAAMAIAFFYPLDASVHAVIQQGIELRRNGQNAEDPLRPGTMLG